MIQNIWYDYGVSDQTVTLLCSWVEYRTKVVKGPFLPLHSTKYLVRKKYNKNNVAIYHTTILEGIEHGRSTAPKPFTKVQEFTYSFYSLSKEDQIIILSYIDPMNELNDRVDWISYLKSFDIRNCDARLICAMVQLQKEAEKRNLVRSTEGEISGWDNIADFLKCTKPTAIKLARDCQLPITKFGGRVYTTAARLQEYIDQRIDSNPYWKTCSRKPKKRKK